MVEEKMTEDSPETLWEKRFYALARILEADRDAIRQAFEEAPSEHKQTLREMFATDSENFMGTGLNFREFWQLGQVVRLRDSYVNQNKEERKRRLELVIRASAALEQIRTVTLSGIAWGEWAIEAILTGEDKDILRDWGKQLAFRYKDDPREQEFLALWGPFTEIVKEAVATTPKRDTPE